MLTINITNSTVTITANDKQVDIKPSDRSTKDKGPFENRCSEIPMPEKVQTSEGKQRGEGTFMPVSDSVMQSAVMGTYRDLFNNTRQDMQQFPYVSHFDRHQRIGSMYQPPVYPQRRPSQQVNTFASRPANSSYHPPHHPVEHEPKGKSTGVTDEMLLPTLRSIPQSNIGYTTSARPWSIKDIVDTEMNTQTVSLQDIQRAMISTTFWVKGYNEYTHKYAYNSWTKVANNSWVINDTIYESFIESMTGTLTQQQEQQQGNTFASYPVTVDNFTPHYDESIRESITNRMVLNTLKYVPDSKIGRSLRGSIAIKDINDTGLTTQTVELAFLEGTPIGATVFVKGYNANMCKCVYNSWTKVEDNGWKVNATIYEPIISGTSSKPEQTPEKQDKGITDDQLIETFRALPKGPVMYALTLRPFKHAYYSGLTAEAIPKESLEKSDVGVTFLVCISGNGLETKAYLCWTKVANNNWVRSVETDESTQSTSDTPESQATQVVHFNTSTAGLLSFLSEIKNPEKWELAYTSSHYDVPWGPGTIYTRSIYPEQENALYAALLLTGNLKEAVNLASESFTTLRTGHIFSNISICAYAAYKKDLSLIRTMTRDDMVKIVQNELANKKEPL